MRKLDWKWLAIPGAAIVAMALGMIPAGAKAPHRMDFSMIEEHGVALFDLAQVPASEPPAQQAAAARVVVHAAPVAIEAPAPPQAPNLTLEPPAIPDVAIEPPAVSAIHVAPVFVTAALRVPAPEMRRQRRDDDFDMPVHQEETIQKTFTMAAGSAHKSLAIDNVWGSIEVKAIDGDQVQLVVSKTIRAETQAKLDQAKKDVTLDITDQPDLVKLYVNGPFRCDCDGGCNGSHIHWDDPGYVVRMDFQLQVPRNIDVDLRTVNSGEINVSGVSGAFEVRNVNGTIDMTDVAGSGSAKTVNGHLKVSFREAPKENSSFGTVNGAVDLAFPKSLSADFRFKTFNGGIYTDFPVTTLPIRGMEEQHEGSKVIFRADRYTGGRIGSGGPEIRVDTLNGDIRILSKP